MALFQWTGLLVEPNLWYYNKLLQKNRKAWSIGHCLSSKTHPEVVLFDNAADQSGVINTGLQQNNYINC